jgi:hypothetical protein
MTFRKLFWKLMVRAVLGIGAVLVAVLPTVILVSLGYQDAPRQGWGLVRPVGEAPKKTPNPADPDGRPGENPHGSKPDKRVDDKKVSAPDASRFLD